MRPVAAVLLVPALVAAWPAVAAERTVAITGFERLRVETPVAVRVTTGGSPGARLSGDGAALDGIDLRQTGTTLVITRRGGTGTTAGPVTVTLTTPVLNAASVLGGATLAIDRVRGSRVNLSVGGTGALTVETVDTDQLAAMLVGDGRLTLTAGTARAARLTATGAGSVDAAGVQAGEVTVRLDGTGEVRATARYTATVANVGLGRVTVTGTPRCLIRASTGPVTCGAARP